MRLSVNGIDVTTAAPDPDYSYDTSLPPRTIRNQPISRVAAALRNFKLGDTIYISNSVPYAHRIEHDGWSWQAPDGVFRSSVSHTLRTTRVRDVTFTHG
jgi:hypothetical protein